MERAGIGIPTWLLLGSDVISSLSKAEVELYVGEAFAIGRISTCNEVGGVGARGEHRLMPLHP